MRTLQVARTILVKLRPIQQLACEGKWGIIHKIFSDHKNLKPAKIIHKRHMNQEWEMWKGDRLEKALWATGPSGKRQIFWATCRSYSHRINFLQGFTSKATYFLAHHLGKNVKYPSQSLQVNKDIHQYDHFPIGRIFVWILFSLTKRLDRESPLRRQATNDGFQVATGRTAELFQCGRGTNG